jgi:hypothetical protein
MLGIGLGTFGIFIGLAAIAPRLVRPLAHVVGLPAARLGGVAGRLAQENAVRNPGRTASTAAALMIGLTLVSFVAVFGKALLASDKSSLEKQLGTSHVITSQSGWDTVPLGAGKAAGAAPGVLLASSIRGTGSSPMTAGRRPRRRPGDDRPRQLRGIEGSGRFATLKRGDAVVRGRRPRGRRARVLHAGREARRRSSRASTTSTTSTSSSGRSSSHRRP